MVLNFEQKNALTGMHAFLSNDYVSRSVVFNLFGEAEPQGNILVVRETLPTLRNWNVEIYCQS